MEGGKGNCSRRGETSEAGPAGHADGVKDEYVFGGVTDVVTNDERTNEPDVLGYLAAFVNPVRLAERLWVGPQPAI